MGCRIYSTSGVEESVNLNQCFEANLCCPGYDPNLPHQVNHARCLRIFNTNALLGGGGYICNQENTAPYNGDADQQPFYELIDGETGSGTADHVGYFAVQGQIAGSIVPNNPGDARAVQCAGTVLQKCFTRADSTNSQPGTFFGSMSGAGPVLDAGSIGGLSPIPVVHIANLGAGCGVAEVRLTWNDPWLYAGTMKNGVRAPSLA